MRADRGKRGAWIGETVRIPFEVEARLDAPRRASVERQHIAGNAPLAQFLRDQPPYNNLNSLGKWFAGLGYKGVQIPGWDRRVIDIDKAAKSKAYCDDLKGTLKGLGLEVTEVAGYLAGQVLVIHPSRPPRWRSTILHRAAVM